MNTVLINDSGFLAASDQSRYCVFFAAVQRFELGKADIHR